VQRKEYVKMHDDVIDAGGDVKIFSSLHVSGEREFMTVHSSFSLLTPTSIPELAQLTGVAAILRFPMPELEDSDNEDDSDAD
jgi:protein pelota